MGVLDSFLNFGSDQLTNLMNYQLTRQGWERDDNAVQRRTADLQAAGLNPVLAAGSAATSQAPIPMKSGSQFQGVDEAVGLGAMTKADLKIKDTQAQLLQEQKRGVKLDNDVKDYTNPAKIEQAIGELRRANLRNAFIYEDVNLDMAKKRAETAIDIARGGLTNSQISQTQAQTAETAVNQLLREGQIKEVEARTALAIALGKMSGMDQSFFDKLGLAPKALQTIMGLLEPLLKLITR